MARDCKQEVEAFLEEVMRDDPDAEERAAPSLAETKSGRRMLRAEPERRTALIAAACEALIEALNAHRAGDDQPAYRRAETLSQDLIRSFSGDGLFDSELPYNAVQLSVMVLTIKAAIEDEGFYVGYWFPADSALKAAAAYLATNPPDARLLESLETLRDTCMGKRRGDVRDILKALNLLMKDHVQLPFIERSPSGGQLEGWLSKQDDMARQAWLDLMAHGRTAGDKARPSATWSKTALAQVQEIGEGPFAEQARAWLDELVPDPARPDPNLDIFKGLVWMLGLLGREDSALPLGDFARRCFTKVPNIGARSVKLGNAAVLALSRLEGSAGLAQLTVLRRRIRYPSARRQIEKALNEAAERAGLSVGELEELAVPDFGLTPDGARRERLGDFEAEIRITGSDSVALTWIGADGKARKTVPAAVKRDHEVGLKALKLQVREIKEALSGQAARLEQLYFSERSWPLELWRQRYRDHPLMSHLVRRLIWRFQDGSRDVAGIAIGEAVLDQHENPLDWLGDATEVRLWHPLTASPEDVLAWRRRLESLEITQPFKQAHREIYILTDAERQTETYSNRFAAHILKQHQFRALCQQRGWRYDLQGAWDSHNTPELSLPAWNLSAQFWVEPAASEDLSEAYIYLYLATDQLRFGDGSGDALPLAEVPAMAFSETMRDVDLFVSVASVGNDPNWVDGGPGGHYADYWSNYSFGELAETAKTRRAVLETLVPKLKIADRCELTDKFLVVRGTKRSYKIHLGSANILMSPNDQYLCIVRDAGKGGSRANRVRLPFEGDSTLSLVLSKAFLLVEDDKITDKTILAQIDR